ncbi:MAG TPA: hypothetical protein VFG47_04125 [Geminicoccaceae bacterium]|nr:hypothetical protein [Geminicoccaceae bacterium]
MNQLEEARRLAEMLEVVAGGRRPAAGDRAHGPPSAAPGCAAREVVSLAHRLVTALERLERRVALLEAELAPHRSRKCPRCGGLTLAVVATMLHPEFGFAGVEQHEVRCGAAGCSHSDTRLYDPRDYLR